ncbi:D-alanyl-D-alanine carboxypeptidase [Virgibacillus halodenitrificans]|uniref:serine-type D-Ala-D-Ala carboxypeptidase n=1 Tax=Virgibacillus halodenitrificans TaxID=1482 RepID=A0ABR7VKT0_VIRHA|nr:serine hydrolase [Virgibacillus halodenitrificans]MBD1222293.1 D-alanyl-D-alanine carboxypeptidase [Virgibacillus halodenitrificans]MCG1027541.1 D-alanyl-D-alanine carboxypeptidase [Virgibacillus halodenitrificans]MCJ0931590.1 D-alanyl-D-alanine carboxypeptidase [Virgibacillus halodenitrificans]MEC2157587.1 serine hydrolase [Virgibacillus halodenitrificans]
MKHNFKKGLSFILAVMVALITIMVQPFSTKAAETLDIKADSAILVDVETGKILYSKNADQALPPASMTKMMTEYLVWEAIEKGDISWDTTTQISDYPYSISANTSFSGVGLKQSQDYTVKDLYKAMAINSDNATTIALAELIAGSEGEFVKMMNEKGKEMGLPDFKFVNSTGLDNASLGDNYPEGTDPNATNLLSAESAALLAYKLIKDYPEALDISSIPVTDFDGQKIRNWNHMLPHDTTFLKQFFYEGVDGLKTGYTDLAGYCFTGSAERNGNRLISVVMKTGSEEERFQETAKLFDYGFSKFETKELFPEGYQLKDETTLPVAKGKEEKVNISTNKSVTIPVKSGQEKQYSIKYNLDKDKLNKEGELLAPIKKGEKIGTAEVVFKGDKDYGYITKDKGNTIDLVTNEAVEKSNWFMLTLGAIGDFFVDLFTTVVDWIKGLF